MYLIAFQQCCRLPDKVFSKPEQWSWICGSHCDNKTRDGDRNPRSRNSKSLSEETNCSLIVSLQLPVIISCLSPATTDRVASVSVAKQFTDTSCKGLKPAAPAEEAFIKLCILLWLIEALHTFFFFGVSLRPHFPLLLEVIEGQYRAVAYEILSWLPGQNNCFHNSMHWLSVLVLRERSFFLGKMYSLMSPK